MTSKRAPSLLTVCVLAAVVALSVVAWQIIRDGVERQDDALLKEQTSEAVLRLQRNVEQTSLDLGSVGVEQHVFEQQAKAMRTSPATTVALVTKGHVTDKHGDVAPGPPEIRHAVGPALHRGEHLTGELARIASMAGPTLAASPVIHLGVTRSLVFSIVPPSIGLHGYVALQVSPIATAQTVSLNGPYDKLDVALYATPNPQPDELIASTTGRDPLPRDAVTTQLRVGSVDWAAVGAANAPLLNGPAQATPWIVLIGGLLLALGLATTVESLVRRQRSQRSVAETQRRNILLMQFALLPETVPEVNGVAVGWHYQTGGEPSVVVGGDWLAFVPIGADQVGLAVGDVAGHGINAVRNMAQYRFALRTLAAQAISPCAVLAEVDDTARLFNIKYYSTCVYGVIDTTDATWTYCVAGHPAPLLIRDGMVEVLDGPHGPPLAALPTGERYKERAVGLQDGDLLALYSDGLVERRGERLDDGIRRLGERLRMIDADDDLNDASKAVIADLVGDDPPDDVVIVLARYATAGARVDHA